MNKSNLYEEVAYALVLTKKDARKAVDLVFQKITEALVAGEEVRIKDFATMKTVEKAARNYRNKNGETMTTEAGKRVRVRMSESVMRQLDPAFKKSEEETADEDEEE